MIHLSFACDIISLIFTMYLVLSLNALAKAACQKEFNYSEKENATGYRQIKNNKKQSIKMHLRLEFGTCRPKHVVPRSQNYLPHLPQNESRKAGNSVQCPST